MNDQPACEPVSFAVEALPVTLELIVLAIDFLPALCGTEYALLYDTVLLADPREADARDARVARSERFSCCTSAVPNGNFSASICWRVFGWRESEAALSAEAARLRSVTDAEEEEEEEEEELRVPVNPLRVCTAVVAERVRVRFCVLFCIVFCIVFICVVFCVLFCALFSVLPGIFPLFCSRMKSSTKMPSTVGGACR